ncbi:MAG: hypothetical protein KDD58_15470 [Bdellovibrionales bacterium]|nr:hypothetical protein [Bdellovibrionales bacterium]
MKIICNILITIFCLLINHFALAESTFNEVVSILENDNPLVYAKAAQIDLDRYQNGNLPHYPVNMSSIFEQGSEQLIQDAKRTVNDKADYYEYLPKLLHSNGVCITGEWVMDASSPFTGAFKGGNKSLFIGRISTAMEQTTKGNKRGFGFAGKIFPTLNTHEPVQTENFFTVDVLMGTETPRYLQTATTNQPEIGFSWSLMYLGIKIASALTEADEDPGFRPVNNLASLNQVGSISSPKWIKIKPKSGQVMNDESDFRMEVFKAMKENNGLTFEIFWSNTTNDYTTNKGWRRIGEIRVDDAIISFGCDRRLHFAHPKVSN